MFFRLKTDFNPWWFEPAALLCIWLISLCFVMPAYAKPETSVKLSAVREENANGVKEALILPYIFATDSLGTTLGVGGSVRAMVSGGIVRFCVAFSE